jgi:tetratricopeptide (TPR) repeat protein
MVKKLYLPLLSMALIALASCSKMGALSSEYFSTTPKVLEAVGGQVPVTINGKFPEKYFKKKATVEVTPVLKYDGGEITSAPANFQGEKIQGNNQTISYKMGGDYQMKANFPYSDPLAKSELYLRFKAQKGNKTYDVPDVKIADGVIATSQLVYNTLNSTDPSNSSNSFDALPPSDKDAFQKKMSSAKEADIKFLIQKAELRASQLKSDQLKDLNTTVKDAQKTGKTIDNLEVAAYASPDGGVKLNDKLAKQREANTNIYLKKQLSNNKVNGVAIDSKYTAQDWDGFQDLVSKSNIQDKDVVLRVLSMYQDPEQREKEIRNLSTVFSTLADEILPELRRSRLTLNYNEDSKSLATIDSIFEANPSSLTNDELLYTADYLEGQKQDDKAKKYYNKAIELYPNDYRAYNNLAALEYAQGNTSDAKSLLQKAVSLNSSAPEVNNNLGLVALKEGDTATAENYLGKAAGAPSASQALGNLYLAQGQYERAETAFGDVKTNSAALSQILNKDYSKAKTTLSNIPNPDAYTDYMTAILGSRTGNTTLAVESLKSAIQKDPSLAKKAATDLEFSSLASDPDFKNLIK